MAQGRVRNSNLDVLRCLTMFLIVLHHTFFYVGCQRGRLFELLFNLLIIWHVDLFIAFSGWFGMRFSLKKAWKLWGVMAFYSLLSICVGRMVLHVGTPFGITGGWYGNTYLCLLLIVPLLNAGIEGLLSKGSRAAWLAWGGFALVILVNWFSRNSYVSLLAFDVTPFALVQMVFIYFTVRLVRLTGIAEKIHCWQLMGVMMLFVLCVVFMRTDRTNYLAPYVIAMAISVLIVFVRYVRIPALLGRLGIFAAPSMFGVYLLHETTSFGREFFRRPYGILVDSGCSPGVAVLLSAVICFGICVVVDLVRRLLTRLIGIVIDNGRKRN